VNLLKKIVLLAIICLIGVSSYVAPSIKGECSQEKLEKLDVIVSIAPLAEWVKSVGGNKVDVTILVPPRASPHTYEPKPSQLIKVEKAKIFVKNGAGLEFWANKIVRINKDILVVDISKEIKLIELSPKEQKKHHLLKDPHLWLSLRNAKKGVKEIYEALSKVNPENEEYYRKNMNEYIEKLDALDKEISKKLKAVKNKKFIVLHPSWSYFSKDYGLEQIPIERGGKEPGPKYIKKIIDTARENNIKVVFVEPQFNQKSAQMIAREIDGRVVSINPLAEDYLKNMRITVNEFVKWLK